MCQCHRQIRLEIPNEMHDQMRKLCRKKKLTLTDIIVAGVEMWLAAENKQPSCPDAPKATKLGV
jgi:hypothetical protein